MFCVTEPMDPIVMIEIEITELKSSRVPIQCILSSKACPRVQENNLHHIKVITLALIMEGKNTCFIPPRTDEQVKCKKTLTHHSELETVALAESNVYGTC